MGAVPVTTDGYPPSTEVVLDFNDVELGFDRHLVLRGISFHLHRGETKVVFGVAGSGKSVLLKLASVFSSLTPARLLSWERKLLPCRSSNCLDSGARSAWCSRKARSSILL